MKKVLVWCPVVKSYVILIYKQFWWINNVTVIFKRLKSLFIYFFIMQDTWRCIQSWILEMFWNIRFIWARLRNQTAKIPRLLNEPKILLIHVFQKRCYVFCLSCNNIKHFTPKTSYFRQISFKVYSWNHNAIASTKQNDDVTIKRAYSNRTRPS